MIDRFIDEFTLEEEDVEKYEIISSIVDWDMVSLAVVLFITAISLTLPDEYTEILGVENFLVYLIFVGLIVVWATIFTSLYVKRNQVGLTDRDLAYHYLSQALKNRASNEQKTMDYFNCVEDCMVKDDVRVLHPKREVEMIDLLDYARFRYEEDNEYILANDYFDKFFDSITGEILEVYESEYDINDDLGDEIETNSVSYREVIYESVSDFISKRRVKILAPISLFVVAILVAFMVRMEWGLFILGGLTLFQIFFSMNSSE